MAQGTTWSMRSAQVQEDPKWLFRKVHLIIITWSIKIGVEGTLKKSQGQALITNRMGPIRLAFSVRQKESTQIVLDLVVLDMRDHPSGSYELHTKGYELYSDGRLIEKIPPE
jgi:hypothetical protein